MSIAMTCECGKNLKAADESAGKKVRCPQCGAILAVPAPDVVEPLAEDDVPVAAPPAPPRKSKRVQRPDGDWQVGDEVLASMDPDCLGIGTIQKIERNKALIHFAPTGFEGWVFARTIQGIEPLYPDQEVRGYDKEGTIHLGKVIHATGERVRIIVGFSYSGMISWTDEQKEFDRSQIGVVCEPTSPGALKDYDFAFYENLKPGDAVWAPWERYNSYPGKVTEVKGSQVHVRFDNGNAGWVFLGQIHPFQVHHGEHVTVRKRSGYDAIIVGGDARRVQVEYVDGGKQVWLSPAKLMRRSVLPVGPHAQPTRFAGGLLLKLICIPLGLIFALLAGGLLYWNEDYVARQAETIAEGALVCNSVKPDRVDPAMEGKLVHVAGEATTDDTLQDEVFKFPVSTKALKLVRTVEVFQWVERSETKKEKQGGQDVRVTHYYHDGKWVPDFVSSSGFHENAKTGKKPVNVISPKPPNATYHAKVNLGAFHLTEKQIDRIGKAEKLPVADAVVADPPEELKKKVKVLDGVIYICMYPDTDPSNPNVGDLRITFTEIKPQPVTVVAKQAGDSFTPWHSKAGTNTLDELRTGLLTKADMFEKAAEANKLLNLVLRITGGTILAVGAYLLLVHWWLWHKLRRPKII